LQALPRRSEDAFALDRIGLVPTQDFVEVAAAAEANIAIVQAAAAHAGRGVQGSDGVFRGVGAAAHGLL
jgi:hypothetical protein